MTRSLAWSLIDLLIWFTAPLIAWIEAIPIYVLASLAVAFIFLTLLSLFVLLHLYAPKPRPCFPSEKTYVTCSTAQTPTTPRQLPCWYDLWRAERTAGEKDSKHATNFGNIEPAEVKLSVVFPAYNEENRILPTLEEAVAYLDEHFGRVGAGAATKTSGNGKRRRNQATPKKHLSGYEIIVVNDGSKDKTVNVVLDFAKKHDLHDILRVVTLERNRGKGGCVTHGMRHVRGEYALFADADGASRFSDVGRLIEGCEEVMDGSERGVAIGSRNHLVGSEATVNRTALRNFLMHSFHFVLKIFTPPATSRIDDTQCGFKLFSRGSLPHIIPYMHTEGWIFDIEMLMLAESAPATPILGHDGSVIGTSAGIKVAEVPIEWHEVGGSKLNVVKDSIAMAVGLAVLRASWMLGVYRRRLT